MDFILGKNVRERSNVGQRRQIVPTELSKRDLVSLIPALKLPDFMGETPDLGEVRKSSCCISKGLVG